MIFAAVLVTVVAAALSAALGAFIRKDRALDALPDYPAALKPRALSANTVDIGIVGDSWVSAHKLDTALSHSLDQRGLNASVRSSGHPGAKSRQIYRNLQAPEGTAYSSQHILNAQPDYLIIVAGVNDTAGHSGRSFYAHHVLASLKLAQAYGVHPVVVEVPEYDIEHTRAPNFAMQLKRSLYRALFDGSRQNVIARYRERLREFTLLEDDGKVSFFPFDTFISDYDSSLGMYSDSLHLSDKGARAFAAALSEHVVALHNSRLARREVVEAPLSETALIAA